MNKEELKNLRKEELIDIIIELKNEIAKLKKDSNNSSKPPSTDMNKPQRNQSLRQKSGRKPGGQKGHKGKTREQSKTPDQIEYCHPQKQCEKCGKKLNQKKAGIISKRQEIDLPPIEPIITEYQQLGITCSCGHCNKGAYPERIKAPFQIGRNMKSFLVYLNIGQLIPYKRLEQLCQDIFNFKLCTRTIENTLEEAYQKGKPLHQKIMGIVKRCLWVGSDETGERVEGKRWWKWVWQSAIATYYAISVSRGYKVVEEHFGEDYEYILVHDCWSAHNNTTAKTGHQQCHSHLQRELKFLIETYHSKWAYDLNKFLGASQRARDQIWEEYFDKNMRCQIIEKYEETLKTFIETEHPQKDVLRFQKRIKKHEKSILLFMKYRYVPFHNNGSEQAVRMTKVKQKISGGFRSQQGAKRHAVLLSIIETSKKQKKNILQAIRDLFQENLAFLG